MKTSILAVLLLSLGLVFYACGLQHLNENGGEILSWANMGISQQYEPSIKIVWNDSTKDLIDKEELSAALKKSISDDLNQSKIIGESSVTSSKDEMVKGKKAGKGKKTGRNKIRKQNNNY